MKAWGHDQKIEGSMVTFLSDPAGELTEQLGMRMTDAGPPSVGIIGRCKRFAMVVKNGEILDVVVSEGPGDPAGDGDPSATLADGMIERIKNLKEGFKL